MGKRKYDKAHKEWAEAVKSRDGRKCVFCDNGGDLHKQICAHHLIPWEVEKFRFDVNNGITLCSSHHTKYGCGFSPHSDGAALFFFWLFEQRPEIYKWLRENFPNASS